MRWEKENTETQATTLAQAALEIAYDF